MNTPRARRIVEELKGKKVGRWTIIDYINHGKTAVVTKATRRKKTGALKIFDPDIVEHLGRDEQLARIEREKGLIGKTHPNLIEILDGGACLETKYLYVVMSYLPDKNLFEVYKKVPRNEIFTIISQVASAANFLEEQGLAHRDIKPENIAISEDFEHATLLDLGVLRPLGLSEIDGYDYQRAFLATLQYSPPELLYRFEEDNIEGWRAVTFYQLGAVLHDLLMRKPIFNEFRKPYARLVDAVRDIAPVITAGDVENNLVLLAQSCLLKVPQDRLSLVGWDDFLKAKTTKQPITAIRERITIRRTILESQMRKPINLSVDSYLLERFLRFQNIVDEIKNMIRTICLNAKDYIPPIECESIIAEKTTEASICVCFHQSSRHTFYKTITLLVLVSLLGDRDEIIDLKFIALDADDCINQISRIRFDNYHMDKLFYGPYEPATIKDRIILLLLTLIDNVLDRQTKGTIGTTESRLEPTQLRLNLDGGDS